MIRCNQKDILNLVDIYEVVSNNEFNNIKKFCNNFVIIAMSRTGNYYLVFIDDRLCAYKVI